MSREPSSASTPRRATTSSPRAGPWCSPRDTISSPQSDRALEELCRTYWYPLYAYVRRRGHAKEDAEDLTQAFFARFLEKNYLGGLAAERGKFRAFLLASLKHFLANEWDKAQRQKRGGGAPHLSLDWQDADGRFHLDPPDPATPEQIFDREWALALLERVVQRLRDECAVDGRATLFEQAKGFLAVGQAAIPYAAAAPGTGPERRRPAGGRASSPQALSRAVA